MRRVVSAGMRNPPNTTALLKSSMLTSGRTFRCTRSPLIVGRKSETNAKFLELHRDADVGTRALRDRNGELAAREEARFLAAFGYEVRFGETLEQALALKSTNEQP